MQIRSVRTRYERIGTNADMSHPCKGWSCTVFSFFFPLITHPRVCERHTLRRRHLCSLIKGCIEAFGRSDVRMMFRKSVAFFTFYPCLNGKRVVSRSMRALIKRIKIVYTLIFLLIHSTHDLVTCDVDQLIDQFFSTFLFLLLSQSGILYCIVCPTNCIFVFFDNAILL